MTDLFSFKFLGGSSGQQNLITYMVVIMHEKKKILFKGETMFFKNILPSLHVILICEQKYDFQINCIMFERV